MSGKRTLHPLVVVLIFALVLILVGLLVFSMALPPSMLLLLIIPLIVSSLYYDRRVYLTNLLLAVAAAVWISLEISTTPTNALLTIAIAAPSVLAVAEIIHYYTRWLRRSEQNAADSEARLHRFLETATQGFFLVNAQAELTEWNYFLEQLTGVKRADVSGKPVWDILLKLLPEDQKNRTVYERFKNLFQEILRKNQGSSQPVAFDLDIQTPDGAERALRIQVWPVKTDEGWMAGAVARDMTDSQQEDSLLRKANDTLAASVKEMEARTREANLLNEMGDLLQSCRSLEDTYAVVSQYAEKIFPEHAGILYVLDNEHNLFEAVSSWGGPVPSEPSFAPDACWTLRRGRMHIVADPTDRLVCPHLKVTRNFSTFTPYLCASMTAQGETLGVLHIQARNSQSLEMLEKIAEPVATRVGLAVANLKLRETLRVQSIRDPLTGMFNRRYMEETLERELHRAARHQLALGVIMLDIDHFKVFNDSYGHETGDDLLRELGAFLQANVRSEDIPCRYGGEEFIIILPEATLDQSVKRAIQLREGINNLKIQRDDQTVPAITVSQGVAGFPEHGASAGQLLRAVDAALYRAKRAGRDRVTLAER